MVGVVDGARSARDAVRCSDSSRWTIRPGFQTERRWRPRTGSGAPSPNTTTINASTGAIIQHALEGAGLWGGMPSVNPVNPNLIAFAGQPVSGSTYNQDKNYIYVMDTSGSERADSPRVRSAYKRIIQSGLSGPGAVVVAGRQVGRLRIEPPVAIRSQQPLRHLPVRVPWLRTCDADHQHDLQLQSRQMVSDRVSRRSERRVSAYRGVACADCSERNPSKGPYGLSVLDLTPLGITF